MYFAFPNRRLTNLATAEVKPYARACTEGTKQQWKLNADNNLRPKKDPRKCLSLIEPGEGDFQYYGFKVLPCSDNYRNKKFMFEYLTQQIASEPMLHTFFKLKVENENFYRESWRGQSWRRFSEEGWKVPDLTLTTYNFFNIWDTVWYYTSLYSEPDVSMATVY